MAKPWTQEEKDYMFEAIKAGELFSDIGKNVGRSVGGVRQQLRGFYPAKDWTDEQRKDFNQRKTETPKLVKLVDNKQQKVLTFTKEQLKKDKGFRDNFKLGK